MQPRNFATLVRGSKKFSQLVKKLVGGSNKIWVSISTYYELACFFAIRLTPTIRQGRGEEAPLQNPRPPETSPSLVKKRNSSHLQVNSHNLTQPLVNSSHNGGGVGTLASNRCHEQKLMYRAKRWSANLSR